MSKIIILGSGLVGGVIAKDLANNHDVTAIDISQKNLNLLTNIKTICLDITNKQLLQNAIKDFDIVVGAVPGLSLIHI